MGLRPYLNFNFANPMYNRELSFVEFQFIVLLILRQITRKKKQASVLEIYMACFEGLRFVFAVYISDSDRVPRNIIRHSSQLFHYLMFSITLIFRQRLKNQATLFQAESLKPHVYNARSKKSGACSTRVIKNFDTYQKANAN
jgi:hypothetical protein